MNASDRAFFADSDDELLDAPDDVSRTILHGIQGMAQSLVELGQRAKESIAQAQQEQGRQKRFKTATGEVPKDTVAEADASMAPDKEDGISLASSTPIATATPSPPSKSTVPFGGPGQ